MAVRLIRHDDSDPALRQRAQPVTVFDAALQTLVADMIDTMHAADGIGLAAPQIGLALRLFVLDIPEDMDYDGSPAFSIVVANPRIVDWAGDETDDEGCLSIPGWYGAVARPAMVVLTGQDVEGKPITVRAEELPARALQHETDHLDGILYADKVEDSTTFYRLVPKEPPVPTALESVPAVVARQRAADPRKPSRAKGKAAAKDETAPERTPARR